MLSAVTMIAEDGSYVLNPITKEPTLIPFTTWEHSLGVDAIAAALLDKHDVKINFARIKQKRHQRRYGDVWREQSILGFCYQRYQSGWNRLGTWQYFYFLGIEW